ncbi:MULTISPECIES: TIR domain-containing protein [Pseudoalteromonas]|uniref:Nucleotide-binding protein n=1 Tax=Pseudoalteromonas arctica TaxID=394751 RepID=A0ABU9TGH9_9GAMM|nr:nucleotide-binding protein [Pseudoalteromonas sp. C8]
MEKPRLFIGSSSESYDVASACNACLDRKVEVTIWDKIFNSGGDTLTSLTDKAKNVDFALFIFRPEDLTVMRNSPKPTVRDNVIFELGLFIGALGKERCFILKPRGEDLHMPTDLLGLNINDYDPNRRDNELESAVNAACTRFLRQIDKLGSFDSKSKDDLNTAVGLDTKQKYAPEHVVTDSMISILCKLLSTVTDNDSISAFSLSNTSEPYGHSIALIKLERMRLIERVLDSDFNGNEWYGYKLTQDGVEYVLKNESRIDKFITPIQQPQYRQSTPQVKDDDISF